MLFIHLLDTAKNSGVSSFADATGVPVPSKQIIDNFAAPMIVSNPLVASGTGNTFLTSRSFSRTPITYTHNFTAAQLVALDAYIANGGNIAFGLDPDYFNEGSKFSFNIPEAGSTVSLLGLALVGLALVRRNSYLAEQTRAAANRVGR